MQAIGSRIETRFELHVPQKRAVFQPGATEHGIQHAEIAVNVPPPEDVKAAYCLHNGSRERQSLIGNLQFNSPWVLHSLEEILPDWNILRSVRAELFAMNQDDFFGERTLIHRATSGGIPGGSPF